MSDVAVGSHWHYQIMYHRYENPTDFTGEGYYAVHEMYPSLDLWTEKPVDVTGSSVEDVKKSLLLMLKDIEKYGVKDYG